MVFPLPNTPPCLHALTNFSFLLTVPTHPMERDSPSSEQANTSAVPPSPSPSLPMEASLDAPTSITPSHTASDNPEVIPPSVSTSDLDEVKQVADPLCVPPLTSHQESSSVNDPESIPPFSSDTSNKEMSQSADSACVSGVALTDGHDQISETEQGPDDDSDCESLEEAFDFSVKLGEGKEVRSYQMELAEPGIQGKNCIIVAPTGSGKTLVAALVISKHLEKNQHKDDKPKVVFIVNTKPLAEQQKKELDQFIPGAKVDCSMGDGGAAVFDLLPHNDIIVCTAGKLLDSIKSGKVTFDHISLMVIDECHHTKKSSPQANVMLRYLEHKTGNNSMVPQIIGLTASPGAGDNPHLDEKATIIHLVNLCALMDATRGIVMVKENLDELDRHTNKPSFTLEIPQCRSPSEPFVKTIVHEMERFERMLTSFKCSFSRWSQEYETIVQQLKQKYEMHTSPEYRDQISTLRLLRCYSQALNIYMDLNADDAISVLQEYTGLPADDLQATEHECELKKSREKLLIHLKQLDPIDNPLLVSARDKLTERFSQNPSSKGIMFVRTKKHARSICQWIANLKVLSDHGIKPRVLTGHTRETGAGMTQVDQKEVMDSFREGVCNLLVATSVAEEGLDVPACNLMIRFQHVSNEIAKTQTLGRARAEESEGLTILSSDSKKRLQELKNEELLRLVEECMQWFPVGQTLIESIEKRQKLILMHHRQKIALRKQLASKHSRSDFQLKCKSCKVLACEGSDIYLIDGTFHHAVPVEEFKQKVKSRPHRTPRQLTQLIAQTHKIFCASCDSEWGIMATWPSKGLEFPVLKCKQFIFESNGQVMSIKKWSDAPFELLDLSVWLEAQNPSDESGDD